MRASSRSPRCASRGRSRPQWYALGGFGAKRRVTGAPSSRPPRSSQKWIAQCLLSLACMRLHSATRSSSASTTTPSAGWAVRGSYLQSSRATHRPRNSSLRQICGHVNRLPIRCSLSPLFSPCPAEPRRMAMLSSCEDSLPWGSNSRPRSGGQATACGRADTLDHTFSKWQASDPWERSRCSIRSVADNPKALRQPEILRARATYSSP